MERLKTNPRVNITVTAGFPGRIGLPLIGLLLSAGIAFFQSSCPTFDWDSEPSFIDPVNIGDLEVPGDAAGRASFDDPAVYGFSQSWNIHEDSQIYTLRPDVNMRAWQKWDRAGLVPGDYYPPYIANCRANNIIFIAGGTMSVLFEDEAADNAQFLDWATRDAQGNLVRQNAYHGSMANPSYRAHLLDYLKVQIDLGVDGLFLDELNVGYSGGTQWGYNGNEGYDDYFIRDFNRYLMNKYPAYKWRDWNGRFGMTQDNIIRRDVPYYDLANNFNYRRYLQQRGWSGDPQNPANPLAAEWGRIVGNRFDVHDASFTGKYMGLYIKEIMVSLRTYARDTYSKEILITANGIMPWTDFNSLGLYEWNPDEPGNPAGADYVPVQAGHLNGSKSLKSVYLGILAKSREVSGEVPLVLFMDWPCTMIDGYYNLPLSEKQDFWRIYAAEAYACGLRFAFHLRTTMPDEPTATDSGILGFLADYAQFYKNNAGCYRGAANTGIPVAVVNKNNITANLTHQADRNRYLLHLVNHNYVNNQIVTQTGLTVSVNLGPNPVSVSMISPDSALVPSVPFTKSGNTLTITVDQLLYYDILVIE